MTRAKDISKILTDADFSGTLDVTGETTLATHLNMGDGDIIKLGDSADLQIYHDGSNSIIKDAGTGNLVLDSDGTEVRVMNGSEFMGRFQNNDAVKLFFDNSKKFETTSHGISVTGSAIASTQTAGTVTGTTTADFDTYQNFVWTLTGNVTLDNPSTEKVGQSGFITFIQDGTGGRTVSLGTDYETAGGAGLTLSSAASATDVVPYIVVASGRILLGTPQLAFS